MSVSSKVELWAERGVRLRGDHDTFNQRFDELCKTGREGDWEDVDALWGPFAKEFEEHMAFEEQELFDAFAATGEGPRDVVDTLRDQHRDLREQLDRLGIEIQLHAIRADTIELFIAAIRQHNTVESAHFYPWVDEQLDEARAGRPKGHGAVRSL